MIVLISNIKNQSQSVDFNFINQFPTYKIKYCRDIDIARSIFGIKLLYIGLKYYSINLKKCFFSYNRFGKPSINADIHFSISHSKDYVVCCISKYKVGIDIQYQISDFEDIIPSLSKIERQYLSNITDIDHQKKCFFDVWTIKESYLKFLGTGLSKPLKSFDIIFGKKAINDTSNVNYPGITFTTFTIDKNYSSSVVHLQSDEIIFYYMNDINYLLNL